MSFISVISVSLAIGVGGMIIDFGVIIGIRWWVSGVFLVNSLLIVARK